MSPADPIEAAAGAKRAATMLREARALQRRFDKLAGAADVPGRADPTTSRLLREVGTPSTASSPTSPTRNVTSTVASLRRSAAAADRQAVRVQPGAVGLRYDRRDRGVQHRAAALLHLPYVAPKE
jgi:hypothetical protein